MAVCLQVLLLLTVTSHLCLMAPYDIDTDLHQHGDEKQGHDSSGFHKHHNDLKTGKTDQFDSEFFKKFDVYWNETSKFNDNEFVNDFWSNSDESLMNDSWDLNSNLHKKADHKKDEERTNKKVDSSVYEEKKKNKKFKKNNEEMIKIAETLARTDKQDNIVKSFIRHHLTDSNEEEPVKPCDKNIGFNNISNNWLLISLLIFIYHH